VAAPPIIAPQPVGAPRVTVVDEVPRGIDPPELPSSIPGAVPVPPRPRITPRPPPRDAPPEPPRSGRVGEDVLDPFAP
jgi:hypothetical protein